MQRIVRQVRVLSLMLVVGIVVLGAWAEAQETRKKPNKKGLLIDQVFLTEKDVACQGRDSLTILGRALVGKNLPIVTLGDFADTMGLTLCSVAEDGSKVVALLPLSVAELKGSSPRIPVKWLGSRRSTSAGGCVRGGL